MTELKALREVLRAGIALRNTTPVDDDFPKVMHEFDRSLKNAQEQPVQPEDASQHANSVMGDVLLERNRQDIKWGGPNHDDQHSTADFCFLIQDYAGWARVMAGMDNYEKTRNRLIQVAALACAAVESLDRIEGKDQAVMNLLRGKIGE